jgi:hypothetical protein
MRAALKQIIFAITLITLIVSFAVPTAFAAEGASSNYFPGTYGDFAVAAAPDPGLIFVNYNLFVHADIDRTVLQGRVNLDFETSAYINMSSLVYAFEKPVLGARFAVGGFLPLGYADFEAQLTGPPTVSASDSETALGDIALLPASFYWNDGNWHLNLYEQIIAPTGQYDVDNDINLGRNYWSFDTVLALTNLNMENGREFSLVAGYMINNENDDTDYDTGDELHFDAMFNQFLSETSAIGLHGYYYEQVEDDSGSGAILGDFKGESYGIGPSFLWVPASGGGKFSVSGTWLHDLDATNRLESDYAVVTLVWQFGAAGE